MVQIKTLLEKKPDIPPVAEERVGFLWQRWPICNIHPDQWVFQLRSQGVIVTPIVLEFVRWRLGLQGSAEMNLGRVRLDAIFNDQPTIRQIYDKIQAINGYFSVPGVPFHVASYFSEERKRMGMFPKIDLYIPSVVKFRGLPAVFRLFDDHQEKLFLALEMIWQDMLWPLDTDLVYQCSLRCGE